MISPMGYWIGPPMGPRSRYVVMGSLQMEVCEEFYKLIERSHARTERRMAWAHYWQAVKPLMKPVRLP